MARPRTRVFGADFETDNDGSRAWVVQWSISDGSDEWYGPDLDSYLETISELMTKYRNIIFYFHNLRYDLEFQKSVLERMRSDYGFELSILMRKGNPIQIRAVKNKHSLTLRDSAKKIPGDLRSLGKQIGIEKQESPYPFYPGWGEKLTGADEEFCYCRVDSRIVAKAMQQLHSQGYDRPTMSGDAWKCCKTMIGADANGKSYPENWTWERYFPKLNINLDKRLRRGYFGGINYSSNQGCNQATDERPIVHTDIHNSYGSTMFSDELPCGVPTITRVWPDDYQLYIAEVRLKMKLRPGLMPWYQFKNQIDNILENWEYGTLVEETKTWHELTLTSVDLATISQWYELEFDEEYDNVFFVFKTKTGLLQPYINQFTEIKESSPKGSLDYTHAKLMINSVYGRSALAPEVENVTLEWDEDAQDWAWISEYDDNEENDAYLPFGMFATAYARARLLNNALACLEREPDSVIHCDTDSVICYGEPPESVELGDHLGSWGVESRPNFIFEGGFKRYAELSRYPMESLDDLVGLACAGIPRKKNADGVPESMWVELLDDPERITLTGITLGNQHYKIKSEWLRQMYIEHGLDPDDVNTMKLIPEKVPGGVILRERQHQLSDNMVWRLRR